MPLDPNCPAERFAFMLADSAPAVLITTAGVRAAQGTLPAVLDVLDRDEPSPWQHQPAFNPEPAALGLTPRHVAYALCTSGSTGSSKGVMVEHAGLVARIKGLIDQYRFSPYDRVLQFATFTFDASVEEVFCTLCSDATLVMRTDAWLGSAAAFWRRCARGGGDGGGPAHAVLVATR